MTIKNFQIPTLMGVSVIARNEAISCYETDCIVPRNDGQLLTAMLPLRRGFSVYIICFFFSNLFM